jgi:hypothetical protein
MTDRKRMNEKTCQYHCNDVAGRKTGLCDFHYKFNKLTPEQKQIACAAISENPTCGYVTLGYINDPAQFCCKPATHFHPCNEVGTTDGERLSLAGAFWLCDEHEARQPQDMETKMGLWEEL